MKTCTTCRVSLALVEYDRNRSRPDGLHHQCRGCRQKYRHAHRQEGLDYSKKYWATHLSSIKAQQRKTRTGFSPEYFDEMWSAQEGCCATCGRELVHTIRKGENRSNLACADHDHVTNAPRGILCWPCNSGHFGDNPALLRLHAEYLESYQ